MLRIHLALNLSCLLLISSVPVGGQRQKAAPKELVLDWTTTDHQPHRSLGIPGMTVGGLTDRAAGQPHQLPVEILLRKIELQNDGPFLVHVALYNMGSKPFSLPSCQDQVSVQGGSGKNRYTFDLGLEITSSADPANKSEIALSTTFASDFHRECRVIIAPGQTILVVIRMARSLIALGSGSFLARAYARELKLEDDRFFVEWESKKVFSSNTIPLSTS